MILPEPWVQPGPPEYLCFEPLQDNSTIRFSRSTDGNRIVYYTNDFNSGSWTELGNTDITFNVGDKIYCRAAFTETGNYASTPQFWLTGKWKASGKLSSLLFTDNTYTERRTSGVTCVFCRLFYSQTSLYDVSLLRFDLKSGASTGFTRMFYNCSNIESITCDVENLNIQNCTQYMFNNCSKLSYMDFSKATNPGNYYGFSKNVAANGTFVKKAGVSWPSGTNGIPSGWTVIEV